MGIKIELHRLPAHWNNGVEKAEIRGDWTVIPNLGDDISLELICCEGVVSRVAWVAPDHVFVTVKENPNRNDPEDDDDSWDVKE